MTADFDSVFRVVFVATAVPLVLLERVRGLRRHASPAAGRWTSNIALLLLGSLASSILLPVGAYAFAATRPPGLVGGLGLPFAAEALLVFLFLDFWRYWEHRAFHRWNILWRMHLVHHSDTAVDVTTSQRHHPLEQILGTGILMALVVVLGLPAPALGIYLLAATFIALASHANLRMPASIERWLAPLVVTPAVHAIHHSSVQPQTDSNFGTVLTLWDRLFGTLLDPRGVAVARFGLDCFARPADARLLAVLAQPFRYRRDGAPLPNVTAGGTVPQRSPAWRARLAPPWRAALLGAGIGTLLVGVATWSTWLELAAAWHREPYEYGWLVLPAMAYLLATDRDLAARLPVPRPGFAGVILVIVAAIAWVAATLVDLAIGREIALVVALQGIALAALGWRGYRAMLPALALMFLMVPSGDLLEPGLRWLTLRSIAAVTTLASIPHQVDGFVIFVGTHRYIVVTECAGLAFVTLGGFLGYCFGALLYRSLPRTLGLCLLGGVIGIVTNVLRVNAIVLVDWMRGSQMDLVAHGTVQWIALLATLAILFGVLARLPASPRAIVVPSRARPRAQQLARFAPAVAGMAALAIGAAAMAVPASQPGGSNPLVDDLPVAIDGWMGEAIAPVALVERAPGTVSAARHYVHDGRGLDVVVVKTRLSGAKLPDAVHALATQGTVVWREKLARRESVCAGADCVAVAHTVLQPDHGTRARHVYAFYRAGSFTTDSRLALRLVHGWHRLRGAGESQRLVALASEDGELGAVELVRMFRTLDGESPSTRPR